jgi:hypothetical protein
MHAGLCQKTFCQCQQRSTVGSRCWPFGSILTQTWCNLQQTSTRQARYFGGCLSLCTGFLGVSLEGSGANRPRCHTGGWVHHAIRHDAISNMGSIGLSAWFLSLVGLTFVTICSCRCQLQVLHAVACVYGNSCSSATSSHAQVAALVNYCSLPSVGIKADSSFITAVHELPEFHSWGCQNCASRTERASWCSGCLTTL